MKSAVIVDYGSGNLHSAAKALERAACESGRDIAVRVTSEPADVLDADRIMLPGVGAFADCKAGLGKIPGMVEAIERRVRVDKRPFLGICVGMQLMASRGHEFGLAEGFGWIDGDVVAIKPDDASLKIPHMGWNTLSVPAGRPGSGSAAGVHPLLEEIATGPDGLHAYFVHSYHLKAADPAVIAAETQYGGPVTAMVAKDNIAGTQFHPEKSQRLGLRLLANFLGWEPSEG